MTAVGDARKRSQAAQEAAGATNRAGVDSGVGGAENGAESVVKVCTCTHAPVWHHSTRGCGYYGHHGTDRCPCRLNDNEVVDQIVDRHTAAAEAALARVRVVIADWTCDRLGCACAICDLTEDITAAIEGTDHHA